LARDEVAEAGEFDGFVCHLAEISLVVIKVTGGGVGWDGLNVASDWG
jgi:hypothetical protein